MTNKEGTLVCVYGTLRKGFGNHGYLDNEHSELLGSMKTPAAYTMYSLAGGGFPGVAEGGDTEIQIEVYRVNDENVLRRIYRLEGYSGVRGSERNWYDTCDVETPWGTGNMFTMNDLRGTNTKVIESGDWANK
jgi:gamma-glutamylcyclotransferase (GGCT)/AIG2-like uncharacterized protein YtfP